MDYSTREDDDRKFYVGEWCGLELLRNIRGVMHKVKSNYSVKQFCNISARRYHHFNINKFYKNEEVSDHGLDRKTVEYK